MARVVARVVMAARAASAVAEEAEARSLEAVRAAWAAGGRAAAAAVMVVALWAAAAMAAAAACLAAVAAAASPAAAVGAARRQACKSEKRERIESISVPMKEYSSVGWLAIELRVATDAPPRPTAKMVMPAVRKLFATSMAVRSPAAPLCTPSDMSQTTLS